MSKLTIDDMFIEEVRKTTEDHLRTLAKETGEIFGRYVGWGPIGEEIYASLAYTFAMDGAQEICRVLIRLASGELDSGTVMVTDLEYRGLRHVLDNFSDRIPDGEKTTLQELVTILAKARPGE